MGMSYNRSVIDINIMVDVLERVATIDFNRTGKIQVYIAFCGVKSSGCKYVKAARSRNGEVARLYVNGALHTPFFVLAQEVFATQVQIQAVFGVDHCNVFRAGIGVGYSRAHASGMGIGIVSQEQAVLLGNIEGTAVARNIVAVLACDPYIAKPNVINGGITRCAIIVCVKRV